MGTWLFDLWCAFSTILKSEIVTNIIIKLSLLTLGHQEMLTRKCWPGNVHQEVCVPLFLKKYIYLVCFCSRIFHDLPQPISYLEHIKQYVKALVAHLFSVFLWISNKPVTLSVSLHICWNQSLDRIYSYKIKNCGRRMEVVHKKVVEEH